MPLADAPLAVGTPAPTVEITSVGGNALTLARLGGPAVLAKEIHNGINLADSFFVAFEFDDDICVLMGGRIKVLLMILSCPLAETPSTALELGTVVHNAVIGEYFIAEAVVAAVHAASIEINLFPHLIFRQ